MDVNGLLDASQVAARQEDVCWALSAGSRPQAGRMSLRDTARGAVGAKTCAGLELLVESTLRDARTRAGVRLLQGKGHYALGPRSCCRTLG